MESTGPDVPGRTAPPAANKGADIATAPDDEQSDVKLSSSGDHRDVSARAVPDGSAARHASAPARLSAVGNNATKNSKDVVPTTGDTPSTPREHTTGRDAAQVRSSADNPCTPSRAVKRPRVRSPTTRSNDETPVDASAAMSSPSSETSKLMDKLTDYVRQCGGTLPSGWSVEVRL
jgi:hypothetical protein